MIQYMQLNWIFNIWKLTDLIFDIRDIRCQWLSGESVIQTYGLHQYIWVDEEINCNYINQMWNYYYVLRNRRLRSDFWRGEIQFEKKHNIEGRERRVDRMRRRMKTKCERERQWRKEKTLYLKMQRVCEDSISLSTYFLKTTKCNTCYPRLYTRSAYANEDKLKNSNQIFEMSDIRT